MARQPWEKWYIGEWLREPGIRAMTAEARGVWLEILHAMIETDVCEISGTYKHIAKMCNSLEVDEVKRGIQELELHDVADVYRGQNGDTNGDSPEFVTVVSRRRHKEDKRRAYEREKKKRQRSQQQEEDLSPPLSPKCPPICISDSESEYDSNKEKEEDVVSSWNAFAEGAGLPKIRSLNDKRKRAIHQRFDQYWPEIESVYDEIRGSPFLMGQSSDWSATFDWLWCRTDSFQKILEGNYRKRNAQRKQSPAANYDRIRRAAQSAVNS